MTAMTAMTATIDTPPTAESLESVNADSSELMPPDVVVYPAVDDSPAVVARSAGELLREARAASGMHIATLSMALKVPVKKLEALEADDWSTLPDPVFVRALATSVCRHIKTNSAPILALLPKNPSPMMMDETAAKGLNQRFVAATDPKPSLFRLPVSIPMMLGALLFLLAALILMFLPEMVQRTAAKKTEVVEAVEVVTPTLALSSAPMPVLPPVDVTSSPTVLVIPASSSATTIAAPVVVAPLPVASAPSIVTPITLSTEPILRMVAKGVVWIEVKDAKGTLLVQRTLQPKEVVNASGTAPLAVVVGRINEIQSIDVRGKPFSLAGLSPDNVARFEVK